MRQSPKLKLTRSLIILALTVLALGCIKREPRTRQTKPDQAPDANGRCGLSCRIKQEEATRHRDRANQPVRPGPQPRTHHGREPREHTPATHEPATTPAHRGKGVYHTVKKGETFYRICKTYGADPNEVARANHLSDPTQLTVGQKLWIPGADETKSVPVAVSAPAYGGSSGPVAPPSAMKGTLLFPVPGGNISSHFGPRGDSMHEGIDILAPMGSPILAAEDGKVVYADDTIRGYGNMVIIKHAGNISTVYAHNSKNLVKSGDLVKRGQKIAEVGQTGRATAPHCHFEVRVGEKPTDPEFFLP